MRSENPISIAITGAGSGLGAALAEIFSEEGRQLHLCARRAGPLAEVAKTCQAKHATVYTTSLDIRDPDAVEAWITAAEDHGPLDVMFLNAGVYGGRPYPGAQETANMRADVLGTNLSATITCAQAIAQRMVQRGKGKIVFISSLAAKLPAADAPTYSASKAGITAYAEALREDVSGTGVRVLTVHPGHIRTHQTDIHAGRLDFLCEPVVAAKAIRRAIEADRQDLSFPFVAAAVVQTLRCLPRAVRHQVLRRHRFYVRDTKTAIAGGAKENIKP